MLKENNRVEYLDIIKFFAILLVIINHIPIFKNESIFSNVIKLFCQGCIPCFFMVTGSIFLNREFNFEKWIKRLLKTYVVLIIWKLIYLVFFVCWYNMSLNQIINTNLIKYIFLFTNFPGIQFARTYVVYKRILICFVSISINFIVF